MVSNDTPRVSIVLPVYNRADSIAASIDSVLRQTWQDFELLVVDDGSTDTTRDVISGIKDARIKLLSTPRNMGPSGARNIGIAQARGEWIAFQDSDDEWLPEKLDRQMERLAACDEKTVAVYCGMAVVGSVFRKEGARTKLRYIPSPDIPEVEGDILHSLLRTSLVSTQMLVARRDVLQKIGGFDENLLALVDWDLSLRLAAEGQFAFVDEPLVLQRFSENSITRDQARRAGARTQILVKHHDTIAPMPDLLAQQYRVLAGEYRMLGRFEEAQEAMRKARKARPADPGLMARALYLKVTALIHGRGEKAKGEP